MKKIISNKEKLIIGIDASRCRSGGAQAHLIGLLSGDNPNNFGIETIHLWGYSSLMRKIPDYPWLVKHTPKNLNRSLLWQLIWQYFILPKEFKKYKCSLLFNTDAGSISGVRNCVTLSQNLLPFDSIEINRFSGYMKLRLLILKNLHKQSLKKGRIIFLTRFAKQFIEEKIGFIETSIVIPHGVNEIFFMKDRINDWRLEVKDIIWCVYVSNVDMYKHQWNVVDAIGILRKKVNKDIRLLLIGGGTGKAQDFLEKQINLTDPKREFIKQVGFVSSREVAEFLRESDLFVFASSCENMPVTLLEGMASGLPIACSNRGPMPEILEDGGVYFDPENPLSIAHSLEDLIVNPLVRQKLGKRSAERASMYTWGRCAMDTWKYLILMAHKKSI